MSFQALNFDLIDEWLDEGLPADEIRFRMRVRQSIEAGDADRVSELLAEYDGVCGVWEARRAA